MMFWIYLSNFHELVKLLSNYKYTVTNVKINPFWSVVKKQFIAQLISWRKGFQNINEIPHKMNDYTRRIKSIRSHYY